jgi:predicted nucleic acid-binding Zn ribbon protein
MRRLVEEGAIGFCGAAYYRDPSLNAAIKEGLTKGSTFYLCASRRVSFVGFS